ncbi:helix-turn-helix transcriptional regulator [Sphingobacterium sp. NPDC055346]
MEKNELILEKLDRLENYLLGFKSILTVEELAVYSGYKPSYIYQLVRKSLIPFHHNKSGGSKLFFEKKAIDQWLLGGEYKTTSQSTQDAFNYIGTNNRRRKKG